MTRCAWQHLERNAQCTVRTRKRGGGRRGGERGKRGRVGEKDREGMEGREERERGRESERERGDDICRARIVTIDWSVSICIANWSLTAHH